MTPVKKPILKKIWDITTTVIVVIFVLAAIFLMGSRLLGYEVFNVISGSMEPTYSKGDLIYVKEVDPYTIRVGDPITFVANEELVVATHRVIKVDLANQQFYTKGDANEDPDQKPVSFRNVKGVPQFSIPYLGYVSDYIANPPGTYVAIGAVVIMLILAFLPDVIWKKPDEKAQNAPAAVHTVPEAPVIPPVENAPSQTPGPDLAPDASVVTDIPPVNNQEEA